jgi:flagellar biosynthesis protein FlhA
VQHGLDIAKALQTYTVLTIGDGLVTVIPALMISISGGMIITRASSENRLGVEFQKQVFGAAQPLMLSSGVLIALARFPACRRFRSSAAGRGPGDRRLEMKKKTRRYRPRPTARAPKPERIWKICCGSSRFRSRWA